MCSFHVNSSSEIVQNLTSLHLLHRFVISQLKGHSVQILSTFGDKLLVGSRTQSSYLLIYSFNDNHLTPPSTILVNTLTHVTWTPRGKIVYTSAEVVTITELGKVMYSTFMPYPLYLSVSNDKIIYLADRNKGIFQSTDDGKTWKLIFKPNDEWNSYQTFKATVGHTDHLWTWQMLRGVKVRLCIYSLNEQGSIDNNAKCQNVKVPGSSYMSFHPGNLLVVNKTNILYSDDNQNNLHLFSSSGHYQRQSLTPEQMKNKPWPLTIDKKTFYFMQDKIMAWWKSLN